jgi:hypothetical protein
MRVLILAYTLLSISACVSTTEDLFAEANQTGNWTAVNERLEQEQPTERSQQSCRTGWVLFCEVGNQDCICVTADRFDDPDRHMSRQMRKNRR